MILIIKKAKIVLQEKIKKKDLNLIQISLFLESELSDAIEEFYNLLIIRKFNSCSSIIDNYEFSVLIRYCEFSANDSVIAFRKFKYYPIPRNSHIIIVVRCHYELHCNYYYCIEY